MKKHENDAGLRPAFACRHIHRMMPLSLWKSFRPAGFPELALRAQDKDGPDFLPDSGMAMAGR